jgi:hypothetical protein
LEKCPEMLEGYINVLSTAHSAHTAHTHTHTFHGESAVETSRCINGTTVLNIAVVKYHRAM